MTTPTEAASRIVDLKAARKQIDEEVDRLQTIISNAIDLGELDELLMADDKGYRLGDVRVCPVSRTTYKYFDEVTKQISQLQEQAKVEGKVIASTSLSYRYTVITED